MGDGPRMSSRSVHDVWFRARCRQSLHKEGRSREWAASSEELADLQASLDEEIRRLTELFRTGCRPPMLKRPVHQLPHRQAVPD